MTNMTTMTRTIRLAIGTAVVLALMSQAAQARPSGLPAPTEQTHITASSSILKDKLQLPPAVIKSSAASPASHVALARGEMPLTQTVTAKTSAGGFDWVAAGIGAGSVLAVVLIGAAALTKYGRRRVPLSA
jgi:hypothetical protein